VVGGTRQRHEVEQITNEQERGANHPCRNNSRRTATAALRRPMHTRRPAEGRTSGPRIFAEHRIVGKWCFGSYCSDGRSTSWVNQEPCVFVDGWEGELFQARNERRPRRRATAAVLQLA
jgi:hypothetical protein